MRPLRRISSARAARAIALRLAVVALPQVEHRVGGRRSAGDAGDEAGHLGQRHGLGAALGEVAAERVVEPPRDAAAARMRLVGGRLGGRASGSQQPMPNSTARVEVARAVDVRVGQRLAQRGRRAARPEQQPDDEAHGAAERDVLDAHQPDAPAGRLR